MQSMDDHRIYKALRPEEVGPSEAAGICLAAVDANDGFVHLSTREQIAETLALHFRGVRQVLLLEYDAQPIGDALVWEPSRGGARFPHLYGELALDAARRRWVLQQHPDGTPVLPKDF
ncbi:MAG: DUF952 domain-containing protein [Pseudomonadota bacterium]